MSSLGQMVAGIAHEINTPLGVAVTAISYLRDAVARAQVALAAGALTGEQAERTLSSFADIASLVLSNLDRSADLVRSVKMLAAEPVGDQRQRVWIRRHVSGIVMTLMPEARRSGLTLLVDCPTEIEVETCPGTLSQVLANLVMNSLRHGFEDRPNGTVLVTVTREQRHLRIIVGDDGVGVEPDAHRRIFEPFYTLRRGRGGRGLGLTIVHNLVTRRLGGMIETEGAPGEGLRQIVTLPLR
jgi:signal transduction histidine kinase